MSSLHPVMPPTMRILVRGIGTVLGLSAALAGVTGLAADSALVALNALGFIGACALSGAAVFYSVALERIGLASARSAAVALTRVLAGSAAVAAVIFFVLFEQGRFRAEASRFGLHSVSGIAVLVVLAAVLAIAWRDR